MKKFAFLVPFLLVASLVCATVSYSFEKPQTYYQHQNTQEQVFDNVNFYPTIYSGFLGRILKYYNFFDRHGKTHGGNGNGGGLGCTLNTCY